jgi:hypothetical protein
VAQRLGFSLPPTEEVGPQAPAARWCQCWNSAYPSLQYNLIGRPGVAKFTVADAMKRLVAERGQHLVAVDNHCLNIPIFALVRVDGRTPLPRAVWALMAEVGEAVLSTMEALSPELVVRVHGLPRRWLAGQPPVVATRTPGRSARQEPVRALVPAGCEPHELCRRVVSPARSGRLKLVDSASVRPVGNDQTRARTP